MNSLKSCVKNDSFQLQLFDLTVYLSNQTNLIKKYTFPFDFEDSQVVTVNIEGKTQNSSKQAEVFIPDQF